MDLDIVSKGLVNVDLMKRPDACNKGKIEMSCLQPRVQKGRLKVEGISFKSSSIQHVRCYGFLPFRGGLEA